MLIALYKAFMYKLQKVEEQLIWNVKSVMTDPNQVCLEMFLTIERYLSSKQRGSSCNPECEFPVNSCYIVKMSPQNSCGNSGAILLVSGGEY